jgi:hypothetical protein
VTAPMMVNDGCVFLTDGLLLDVSASGRRVLACVTNKPDFGEELGF